jgi:predicted DsbA family dithiol-disulfide isomerase
LLEYFQTSTKYDNILNSNEKDILIKEAEAAGLPESEIYSLIDKWKKKYDVKEAEYSSSASTSSAVPFDVLLNKTYYEFLGFSEDAEYSQIKEVYD